MSSKQQLVERARRKEQVARFIEDEFVADSTHWVRAYVVWNRYVMWCNDHGEEWLCTDSAMLGIYLANLGKLTKFVSGVRGRVHVGVRWAIHTGGTP